MGGIGRSRGPSSERLHPRLGTCTRRRGDLNERHVLRVRGGHRPQPRVGRGVGIKRQASVTVKFTYLSSALIELRSPCPPSLTWADRPLPAATPHRPRCPRCPCPAARPPRRGDRGRTTRPVRSAEPARPPGVTDTGGEASPAARQPGTCPSSRDLRCRPPAGGSREADFPGHAHRSRPLPASRPISVGPPQGSGGAGVQTRFPTNSAGQAAPHTQAGGPPGPSRLSGNIEPAQPLNPRCEVVLSLHREEETKAQRGRLSQGP